MAGSTRRGATEWDIKETQVEVDVEAGNEGWVVLEVELFRSAMNLSEQFVALRRTFLTSLCQLQDRVPCLLFRISACYVAACPRSSGGLDEHSCTVGSRLWRRHSWEEVSANVLAGGGVDLQQIALKAQSHRSIRREDGLDSLGYVNVVDGFACDLLERRSGAEGCDEPKLSGERGRKKIFLGSLTRW